MVEIKVDGAPCDEDDFLSFDSDDFLPFPIPDILCEKCGENSPPDHICSAVKIEPPPPVRNNTVRNTCPLADNNVEYAHDLPPDLDIERFLDGC